MSEKILSISVAAYNISETIDQVMESLTKDSSLLQKLEIIIVNDGSRDDTSQKAHGYASEYPESVVVIDKENGGYGSTINSSLAAARGRYYKLLDGDDWYASENMGAFLEYLEKAEADIVVTPYIQVKGSDIKCIDNHQEIPEDSIQLSAASVLNDTYLMHEVTVNTEILRNFQQPIAEHCFYTDLEYVFYVLASASTISRFFEPIYCYRLGVEGQSVSITGVRKHYKDYFVVARRMFSFYESTYKAYTGGKKKVLSAAIRNYSYHTYHAYTLLENPKEMKKELYQFDQEIKQSFPEGYSLGYGSKLVSVLRRTKFMAFPLFCKKNQA